MENSIKIQKYVSGYGEILEDTTKRMVIKLKTGTHIIIFFDLNQLMYCNMSESLVINTDKPRSVITVETLDDIKLAIECMCLDDKDFLDSFNKIMKVELKKTA